MLVWGEQCYVDIELGIFLGEKNKPATLTSFSLVLCTESQDVRG